MKPFEFAALILVTLGTPASGAELRTTAIHAWRVYLQAPRSRMEERLKCNGHFLWVQESKQRTRLVRDSGIYIESVNGNGRTAVAGPLIHDWLDARFVCATTGVGAGYIWRLYSIIHVTGVDCGVIIELEAIALSRDIPAAVAWPDSPIVKRISGNGLLAIVRRTREAVSR